MSGVYLTNCLRICYKEGVAVLSYSIADSLEMTMQNFEINSHGPPLLRAYT
jgi:hypothetical protein